MSATRQRPVSSHDVARLANVSQSTVSIALSEESSGRVSAETAARVRAAAQQLGYRPNLAARNLRSRHSSVVLMIIPALTNPYFALVHAGAARVGQELGVGVPVFPVSAEDDRPLLTLPVQAVDGLLVYALDDPRIAETFGSVPTVIVDAQPRPDVAVINCDLAAGTLAAVDHLIALGHRHIGYLHPVRRGGWTLTERLTAVHTAADRGAGVRLTVLQCTFETEAIQVAARQMLTGPDRPTALVCADDNVAAVVYGLAWQLGLRIPDELSIVGFDDLPLASALGPPLTTVRLPGYELGQSGMRRLCDLIRGEPVSSVTLPTSLVIRQSTAPPAP